MILVLMNRPKTLAAIRGNLELFPQASHTPHGTPGEILQKIERNATGTEYRWKNIAFGPCCEAALGILPSGNNGLSRCGMIINPAPWAAMTSLKKLWPGVMPVLRPASRPRRTN